MLEEKLIILDLFEGGIFELYMILILCDNFRIKF